MIFKPNEITITALVCIPPADSFNTLGAQGADCNTACNDLGMVCNPHIVTRNQSQGIIKAGGLMFCSTPAGTNNWFNTDQPGYVSGMSDPNKFRCVGFKKVPDQVDCTGHYSTMRRFCACDLSGTVWSKACETHTSTCSSVLVLQCPPGIQ